MTNKWRKRVGLLLVVFLMGTMAGCGNQSQNQQPQQSQEPTDAQQKESVESVELLISAAASLTDVMAELAEVYDKTAPEANLTFTFGSSGALQSQIEEGAPADVFISAGQKQMDALADKDLLLTDSRKELLVNKVVLITPVDSALALDSFEAVTDEAVKQIALGDPAGVPVGQYSEAVFTYLGIWEAVQAKAVFGSDVRQVLTWVESGEVDCGVVYATDAAISEQVKVTCQAPEGSHPAVIYPAAVIKESKAPEAAQAFVDFLSTDEAAAVFEKYGFAMNQ